MNTENFENIAEFIIKRESDALKKYFKKREKKVCNLLFFPLFNKFRALFLFYKIIRFRFQILSRNQANYTIILDHKSYKYKNYLNNLIDDKLENINSHYRGIFFFVFYIFKNRISIRNIIVKNIKDIYKIKNKYCLEIYDKFVSYVLFYINYQAIFKKYPPTFVFIVDDLSSKRLALAITANEKNIPIILGQNAILSYTIPPFEVDAVLTQSKKTAEAMLKLKNIKSIFFLDVFKRKRIKIKIIPKIIRSIGVLLNNFWIKENLIKFIKILRSKYPQASIMIRYHPNTKKYPDLSCYGAAIADNKEKIKDFSRNVEIVFANSTSSQIEALLSGRAILQISGIDNLNFDNNVHDGLIVGCSLGDLENFDNKLINEFYQSDKWQASFKKGFSLENRVRFLGQVEFSHHINNLIKKNERIAKNV